MGSVDRTFYEATKDRIWHNNGSQADRWKQMLKKTFVENNLVTIVTERGMSIVLTIACTLKAEKMENVKSHAWVSSDPRSLSSTVAFVKRTGFEPHPLLSKRLLRFIESGGPEMQERLVMKMNLSKEYGGTGKVNENVLREYKEQSTVLMKSDVSFTNVTVKSIYLYIIFSCYALSFVIFCGEILVSQL